MSSPNKAIFLMGPTAVGKTELALALAKELPIEIISVDSAMIYKGLDIGTSKPEPKILAKVPHYLIDILDPKDSYSVAEFRAQALTYIQQIISKNKLPLLVGGTMLYFKALRDGLAPLPSANAQIREKLNKEAQEIGLSKLHERLASIDPLAASRIHANDPQRLLRALEVYALTGKTITEHINLRTENTHSFEFLQLAIMPSDRAILHQRIDYRFKQMLDKGLVEEVEHLYKRKDLNASLPSMRAVGYRQIWAYLEGHITYEEMVEQAIISTRQLAKRQLTWLRSWHQVISFDFMDKNILKNILKVLSNADVM